MINYQHKIILYKNMYFMPLFADNELLKRKL